MISLYAECVWPQSELSAGRFNGGGELETSSKMSSLLHSLWKTDTCYPNNEVKARIVNK